MKAEAEPLRSLIAYIQTGEPIPEAVFLDFRKRPRELIMAIGKSGITIYHGDPEYRYQRLCKVLTNANEFNITGDSELLKSLGLNGE